MRSWAGTPGVVAIALWLAAAPIAGCSKSSTAQGRPILSDGVARIVAGQTTEAEVREWFGEPTDVVVTNTGNVLTYQYRKESGGVLSVPFFGASGGASSGQMLIVTVDQDGKVVRHTFIGGP